MHNVQQLQYFLWMLLKSVKVPLPTFTKQLLPLIIINMLVPTL